MTTRTYYLIGAALISAVLLATAVAYPHLPPIVPVHWGAHGEVNGWAAKWTLFVVDPAIMVGMIVLFAALPWLSPKRFEVETFRSTYLYMVVVTLALLAYAHVLILAAGLSWSIDVGRAIEGGVCLMVALLGNVMGKVRRNFYVGIRTPWTIASERVWNKTHRLAAKTSFIAGLLGLLEVLLRAPFWLPIATVLAGPFIPAIYSLVYYKQLEHQGELNG
jgi:uncharacterized membrane protein